MNFMSRIYDLFLDMSVNTSNYLQASSGRDFENLFVSELDGLDYDKISFQELEDLSTDRYSDSTFKNYFKQRIEMDDDYIYNDTDISLCYIEQPFGSQQYPDILVLDTYHVLCIEMKFSTRKSAKPLWNSGMPRSHGIYVFASSGKKDITFFKGSDILSDSDRKLLKKFFSEELERSEEFNKTYMSSQKFGFFAYPRKAYHQGRKFNPDSIINFFDNPLRENLESSLLEHLKDISIGL